MDLSDIYIPPTPAQERDALRTEVKRLTNEVESICKQLSDARSYIERLERKLVEVQS